MMDSVFIICDDPVSYRVIAHELGKVLGEKFNITLLDCGYKGRYHKYPFAAIPAIYRALPATVKFLYDSIKAKHVIFICDIIKHIALSQALRDREWEYTAVFPVESWPLLPEWAGYIESIERRFVISHFGVKVCKEAGLDVSYLPLGIDIEYWTPGNNLEARGNCGKFWLEKLAIKHDNPLEIISQVVNSKVILTIADNQERKNLPACFEILTQIEDKNIMLVIVAPVRDHGWDLHELAKDFQVTDRFVWVGNLPKNLLREHYRAADVFLLPSLAEGHGLPLREAAACGLPWVATDCTAISEAPGGILIEPERETIFPLGNHRRYWINTKKAAEAIEGIFNSNSAMVGDFGDYPTWEDCAGALIA